MLAKTRCDVLKYTGHRAREISNCPSQKGAFAPWESASEICAEFWILSVFASAIEGAGDRSSLGPTAVPRDFGGTHGNAAQSVGWAVLPSAVRSVPSDFLHAEYAPRLTFLESGPAALSLWRGFRGLLLTELISRRVELFLLWPVVLGHWGLYVKRSCREGLRPLRAPWRPFPSVSTCFWPGTWGLRRACEQPDPHRGVGWAARCSGETPSRPAQGQG